MDLDDFGKKIDYYIKKNQVKQKELQKKDGIGVIKIIMSEFVTNYFLDIAFNNNKKDYSWPVHQINNSWPIHQYLLNNIILKIKT